MKLVSKVRDSVRKTYWDFTQEEIFDIVDKYVISSVNTSGFKIDKNTKIVVNIGKIFADKYERWNKIYDDNAMLFSLGYLLRHTEVGQEVKVKDFTCLSKYANGPEDVKKCMSPGQYRSYVIDMVKKYFPERKGDVVVVDVENEEGDKELFTLLESKWIQGLASSYRPVLQDNFTSLDIARYLYRVTQKNKKFGSWIFEETKLKKRSFPGEDVERVVQTDTNYPTYYGLLEVSCRINDLLHWENFQGWASRQYRYDGVIKTILGKEGHIKNIPELKYLQEFCQKKLGKNKFDVFYVDERKFVSRLWEKNNQAEKAKSITRNALRTVLGALGIFGLGKMVYDAASSKTHETNTHNSREALADVLRQNWVDSSKVYQVIASIEFIWCDKVYQRIHALYNTGSIAKDEYKLRILEAIKNNYKRLQQAGIQTPPRPLDHGVSNAVIDRFLMEKFYPSKSYEITLNGWDNMPFESVVGDNTDVVHTTLALDRNLEYSWSMTPSSQITFNNIDDHDAVEALAVQGDTIILPSTSFQDLWIWDVNGRSYVIGIVTIVDESAWKNQNDKVKRSSAGFYVVANPWHKYDRDRAFSTDLAKDVLSQILAIREYAKSFLNDPEKNSLKDNERIQKDTSAIGSVDTIYAQKKSEQSYRDKLGKYKSGTKYWYSGMRKK